MIQRKKINSIILFRYHEIC